MFHQESTAGLFYTNDIKVLIDIVVRQLSDLSPGDIVCTFFIKLKYNLTKLLLFLRKDNSIWSYVGE